MIVAKTPSGFEKYATSHMKPVVATVTADGDPGYRIWTIVGSYETRDGLSSGSVQVKHKWLTGALERLHKLVIDEPSDNYGTKITTDDILVFCPFELYKSVKGTARRYGFIPEPVDQ